MKVTVISIVIGALDTVTKDWYRRIGRLKYKRTSGDDPNDRIAEISHDTEKSPGDLKGLTVTQTPVEKNIN